MDDPQITNPFPPPKIPGSSGYAGFTILLFLFLGSLFYVLAQYAHLMLGEWSLLKAFAIAIPMIAIEYQFVLRGTHAAREEGYSPINTLLLVMIFNFINLYTFGRVALGDSAELKDLLAFSMILGAFAISYRPLNS